MADLASLIRRRWDDCFESGRLLKKQLSDAGRVIKKRKATANKKAGYHKESSMKWKKGRRSSKLMIRKWKERMDKALDHAQKAGSVNFTNSAASKWRVMSAYAVSIDSSFMGKSNFTKWYGGKRELELQRESVHVLKEFCRANIPPAEESSDDEEEWIEEDAANENEKSLDEQKGDNE